MARRRTLWLSISLLGLVILGTVIVLSSTTYYLAINKNAYIDEQEFNSPSNYSNWIHTGVQSPPPNAKVERIPRIIHQTWKTETLPDRWKSLAEGCKDLHPD